MEFEFAVVVKKADGSHPEGGRKHEDHVDVGEIPYQQAGHHYREDDDDSAHRGRSFFLHLPLETEVPDLLAYLHALQAADHGVSEDERY